MQMRMDGMAILKCFGLISLLSIMVLSMLIVLLLLYKFKTRAKDTKYR